MQFLGPSNNAFQFCYYNENSDPYSIKVVLEVALHCNRWHSILVISKQDINLSPKGRECW